MHVRSFVPAVMMAFLGIASAQNTAPAADAASPAPVATAPAADTATDPAAAAAAPAASAAAKAAPQQRCHKELPTGSTLPKTVCEVDDPDMDRARERALDELKHTVRSGTRAAGH